MTGRQHQGRRGRRSLLDERTQRIVVLAVRGGNRLSVAARLAHVSPRTVEEWMRRGRGRDDRPAVDRYVRFVEAIELARAEAEAEAVEVIMRAIPHRPDLARWFLGIVSDDWRRDRRPTLSAPSGASTEPAPPEVSPVVVTMPVEEIMRLARDVAVVEDAPEVP